MVFSWKIPKKTYFFQAFLHQKSFFWFSNDIHIKMTGMAFGTQLEKKNHKKAFLGIFWMFQKIGQNYKGELLKKNNNI